MGRRLTKIGVENTEENRRRYRQILFTSGTEFADCISGIILQEETLYQNSDDGRPFVKLLQEQNILPGVNVDRGMVPLAGTFNECTTQGNKARFNN